MPEQPTGDNWYQYHDEVVGLGRHLVETFYLATAAEVVDYMEKPWKWGPEWLAWKAAENPDLEPSTSA